MVIRKQCSKFNALKHGAYRDFRRIDGRTRKAKQLAHIEASLATALGGEPTPQEILLIQRAALKALRCSILEGEILRNGRDTPKTNYEDYLRWARELRADLQALGLKRREKEVVDLKGYLETAS